MKGENINPMEGDIVNEENSIYDTTPKAPVAAPKPKKPITIPKIDLLSLKRFVPKFKVLIALLVVLLLICIGLLVVAERNKTNDSQIENTVMELPSPSAQTDTKVLELTKKVDQFKKDTDGSVITKKLTPPDLDLDLKF